MAFYVIFALLALCAGQTISPSPTPCSAPPGYFCSGGSALICPIGAYCAGGSALDVSCYPVTACTVAGLSAQPPCYWSVSTLAGSGAAGSSNGQGTAATFNAPEGLALSASGVLFVSEFNGNRIRQIDPAGVVSTYTGGSAGSIDGALSVATFSKPTGLALKADGTLVVCDGYSTTCRLRFITSGVVSSLGVSCGNTVGPVAAAQFDRPRGVLFSADGNTLYVAEDQSSRSILAITNSVVRALSAPVFGAFRMALFNESTMVVADTYQHQVVFLNMVTGASSIFAGAGVSGYVNAVGMAAKFFTLKE